MYACSCPAFQPQLRTGSNTCLLGPCSCPLQHTTNKNENNPKPCVPVQLTNINQLTSSRGALGLSTGLQNTINARLQPNPLIGLRADTDANAGLNAGLQVCGSVCLSLCVYRESGGGDREAPLLACCPAPHTHHHNPLPTTKHIHTTCPKSPVHAVIPAPQKLRSRAPWVTTAC